MLSTQPCFEFTIEPRADEAPDLPPELVPTVPVNGHAVSVTCAPLLPVVEVELLDDESFEQAATGTKSATTAAEAVRVRRMFTDLLRNGFSLQSRADLTASNRPEGSIGP
jgi:hypothetical protein